MALNYQTFKAAVAMTRTRVCLSLVLLWLLFVALPTPSVKAQQHDALKGSKQTETPTEDRTEVLAGLYEQLSKAPDKRSANFIVSTIERLWFKSDSPTVDVLMSRAVLMVQEKDFDTALEILDTVVEIAPDFSEGWNQRATVHFLKRDFQDSLSDLRRVLALDPRHFKAVNGLGLILQEMGDKASALKAFRQAIRLNPHLTETRRTIRELERDVEGQGI